MPLETLGIHTNQVSGLSFVNLPDFPNVPDDFTIFVRFNCEKYWGGGLRDLVSKTNTTSWSQANIRFGILAIGKIICIRGDGTTQQVCVSNSTISTGKWYDVAVTNEGIYINGVLDASASFTITPLQTTTPLRIGNCYGGGWANNFIGTIKHVFIYKRTLTQDEIVNLSKGIFDPNDPDLMLYLPLERHFGNDVIDRSPNGYVGNLNQARWTVKQTGGMLFDNTKAYAYIPDNDVIRLDSYPSFTVSVLMWAKPLATGLYERYAVRKCQYWYQGWGIFVNRPNSVNAKVYFNDGSRIITLINPIPDGYHLYTITYDGTYLKLYLDAELHDYNTNVNGLPLMDTTGLNLNIGGSSYEAARNMAHVIKGVIMWKTKLTESQIEQLYYNFRDPPAKDDIVLWLPFYENEGNVIHDVSGYGNDATSYNTRWVL